MALLGIDIDDVIDFVSKKDKDGDPTIFKLGVLTNRDKLGIMQKIMDDKGELVMPELNKSAFDLVKKGLKKVVNLKKKDGSAEDIDVDDENADQVIDKFPFDVVIELAEQLIKQNFMTEDESKN